MWPIFVLIKTRKTYAVFPQKLYWKETWMIFLFSFTFLQFNDLQKMHLNIYEFVIRKYFLILSKINQILDVWACGKQPGNFLYHRISSWEKPLVSFSKESIAKYYTKKFRAAQDGNSNNKLTGSKSNKQFSILLIFLISSSY